MTNTGRRKLGDDFGKSSLEGAWTRARSPFRKVVSCDEDEDRKARALKELADKDFVPPSSGAQKLCEDAKIHYYEVYSGNPRQGDARYERLVPRWVNDLAKLFYNFVIDRKVLLSHMARLKTDPRRQAVVATLGATENWQGIADYLDLESPDKGSEEHYRLDPFAASPKKPGPFTPGARIGAPRRKDKK